MVDQVRRSAVIAAFAAVYLAWGSTYLALALALESMPPLLLTGARSVSAGAILLGIQRWRSPELPSVRAWASAAVVGVLMFVGCHGTLAYAQQYVSSGLAAVMLATVPFWIALINFAGPAAGRPSPLSIAGLISGIAGVVLIAWSGGLHETKPIAPAMVLLLLVSAFCWAAGSVVSQRQATATAAIAAAGMQLVCGGVVLVVASALAGELDGFSARGISTVSWVGFAYLTIAGSVVAFTAYIWLLDHLPGPLVATYTFVTPVIAVILGSTFLGERMSARMVAGAAMVVGSVIATWCLDNPALRGSREEPPLPAQIASRLGEGGHSHHQDHCNDDAHNGSVTLR
jgi:drug/metabolite transporter (DMT)-like permease